MKKTIAKIMAAAMVLSTVAAPNVLAATEKVNFTTSTAGAKAAAKGFADTATLKINGVDVLKDGNINDDLAWALTDTEYNELFNGETSTKTKEQTFSENTVLKTYTADGGTTLTTTNAVTSGTTSSAKTEVTLTNIDDIQAVLRNDYTAKVFAGNTKAVMYAQNIPGNYFVTNINGVNTVQNIIDRNLTVNGENMHSYVMGKLAVGGIVVVKSNLQVNGVNTGRVIYRALSWNGGNATDDYWNAIVKLKASNNRYTPIRVHVDYVNSSAAVNGLYVSVVGGTAIWVDNRGNRVATTNGITTTTWANNRLQIMDVQPNDLALLQSDVAKGKNLMLDEAYVFDVTGLWNDNGFYSATNSVIDWNILGVDTDLGTVSIGKIQDIRSGLFKKCKEKLVHAKNVKWIRNGAFRENKQLKKAILSDDTSMKKINEKSFYKCKKLNTVKVKVNTLKQVGKNAFGDSTDKKSLKFNLKAGSKAKYNKAVKLFKKSGVKKAKFRKI